MKKKKLGKMRGPKASIIFPYKENLQITYSPYLTLRDRPDIQIGSVNIWNFGKKKDELITDPSLRAKVEGLLQENTIWNNPIDDIGVVSIGEPNFRQFRACDFYDIAAARLILFLAFLSKNNISATDINAGHYMATSENFQFIVQRFHLKNDYVSDVDGYIVASWSVSRRIGEMSFPAPRYVLRPQAFKLDDELITQLLKCQKKQKRLYDRIMRATEIFFESYYNSPEVSTARVLLQMSAFEILLDIDDAMEPRKDFKNKIEHYCTDPKEKRRSYFYEGFSGKKKREARTLKGIWADRFYTLRNHIIHGYYVPDHEYFLKANGIQI